MSTQKFFKTLIPRNSISVGDGRIVKFETLDWTYGYLAPDPKDTVLVSVLLKLIARQAGGIMEIQEAEYQADFAQKKTSSSAPPRLWREELGNSRVSDTVSPPAPPTTSASTPPPKESAASVAAEIPEAKVVQEPPPVVTKTRRAIKAAPPKEQKPLI